MSILATMFVVMIAVVALVAYAFGLSASNQGDRDAKRLDVIETRMAGTATLTPVEVLSTRVAELEQAK